MGRAKALIRSEPPSAEQWQTPLLNIFWGNSLEFYKNWKQPDTIVSDGAYGILGFEGDTCTPEGLGEWYEPHIAAWASRATAKTTLWFWNSEIGWASVHPVLERHGFRYVNANVWNKGLAHIAGNVHTSKIRRFPVVTELCVQYSFEAKIKGLPLKQWLLSEWKRSGLPLYSANTACGIKNAATRKYLDQGYLWYWPPIEMFGRLRDYANLHGKPEGRPYFSSDGIRPMSDEEWAATRSKFKCPHGHTNVWNRPPLSGRERIRLPKGKAIHLNQKPIDLMKRIIEASTDEGDIVWEPFGGLFTASLAAAQLGRQSFGCELDPTYFHYGLERLRTAFLPPK